MELNRAIFADLDPINHDRHHATSDRAWKLRGYDYPLSITEEEGGILAQLILAYELRSGYEVGSGFGLSSFYAGLAFAQTNGRLLSIDTYAEETLSRTEHTPPGDAPFAYRALTWPLVEPIGLAFAMRQRDALGLRGIVRYAIAESPSHVPVLLNGRQIDYAFIDGHHNDGQPWADAQAILPYLTERCVIAFHDARFFADVQAAIRATATAIDGEIEELPTRNRLTLVRRGL